MCIKGKEKDITKRLIIGRIFKEWKIMSIVGLLFSILLTGKWANKIIINNNLRKMAAENTKFRVVNCLPNIPLIEIAIE